MSSPSPGKRRMDTDVMKLYEKHEVNLRHFRKNHMYFHMNHHMMIPTVSLDFIGTFFSLSGD